MSAWSDCINDMQTAIGRPLKDSEIEAIAQAVQVRMAAAKAEGMSARDAAAKVGKEITAEQAKAAMVARFDAANNILKFADLRLRTVEGKEVQAGRSVLSGHSASAGRNAANSVDAAHHTLRADLLGPALRELEKNGDLKAVKARDTALDARVAQEIRRRANPDLEKPTGDKQAVRIAKVLGDVMDTGRAMMNKEGAFIGNIEGYMGRQYHDMWKIRAMGYDGWRDLITKHRDMDTDFKGLTSEQIESNLRATYSGLSSGVHDTSDAPASGFQGSANLGKKLSQDRSITFKSAADWTAYNAKAGKGGVMDAVFAGADGAARDTAIMQKFGTNPKAMWDRWQSDMLNKAVARGDTKASDALRQKKNEGLFENVAGHGQVPGNFTAATIGETVRQSMQIIHLGSILGSALSHTFIIPEMMRHNGMSYWASLANQVRAWVPPGEHQKEIASSLGVMVHHDSGLMLQRFRTDNGVPGKMAEAVNLSHKLSGFSWFMGNQASAAGIGISHTLAYHAGKDFGALDPRMQTALRRYGIEQGEWDTGRTVAAKEADGNRYIIPSNIEDPAVRQKFQTYLLDTVREGMNEPTPWARQAATFGTKPGTWGGEAVRAFTQFKSFGLTMMERQAGRLMREGGFDIPGALYMVLGMSLAGYVGHSLIGLARNETPSIPTSAAGMGALVLKSMIQGGGLGLFGDILARGNARSAGDWALGMAGPLPATVADVGFGISHVAQGGTGSRAGIAAKEGQRVASDLIPNNPMVTAANSYLLGHMFREMVSPGATRRYNNLLREKGQAPILRPALQN